MGKLRKLSLFYRLLLWLITSIIKIGEVVRKVIDFSISPLVLLLNLLFKFFSKIKIEKSFEYKSNIYKWRVKEKSLNILYIFFQSIIYVFKFFLNFLVQVLYLFYRLLKFIFVSIPKFIVHHISLKIRYFIFGFSICLIVIIINQAYIFVKELPSPREIGKSNYSLSTHLFDRKGKLLYEIYREQNRTPVKLDQLPVFITQATIAIEDKDFYLHKGVAVSGGILRAAKEIIFNNSLQGGSTITQQLVKTALLSPERTIKRKIKEIILALWAEKIYSKNRILEMYLNQVPYGGAAHGIEEAAKVYFGVHARDLTLEQAALLAGLPQAPSLYSPYVNPALAQKRRNEVLRSMQSQGFISQTVSNKLQSTKLEVVPPRTNIKAPHFVFYVKSQLEEKYGIRQVEEGGLNVITTLDLDIQEEAEKILKEELEKVKELNVSNGAILVTRPSTGEILAMVGSVDYFASPSGAFNVTTALRQPGSSIKPIMYSLALEKEYTAASIINDTAIIFNIPGSTPYRPVNYDGKTHGNVPLRYALANSFNISAVRVLNTIGVNNFINHAKKMGISTWTDSNRFGLSLTLGGGEVTMIDMAKAFGVFANEGNRVNLTSFNRIVTSSDNLFYQYSPMSVKVIDAGNAFIINDILSDNFARRWAFGSNSALEINGFKVAVKTGTTDEKKDNWTIGYTPDYIVAVWVGNNNNQPMNPYLASGITGAAPIWNRMMSFLLKNYGIKSQFIEPENIVEKICYFGKMEYFVKGTEIKASCRDNLFGATPSPTP
ncbi:penicillin-binding protein [Candidatus Roizmanbacteria bacterium CG_4_9_14_0_8_um_filter_34_12]|uniref:Penicillin-binding protein n=4 Tax=Candidatus Roizmaniibacteriota TaxID=1752723 RepID=A0A2M7E3L5_9BACT|nr:MAG: penicillin-binding protein [Candidatus Roizmanbacteria bacterium CG01_land_8_20_14_3_00_33_9]PIX73800.1 MAG: penicillin-binding protein [Candidatus Roizmanbacteria bacterium CG_4_10_14_3_um_filter_33_21]PJB89409.1 MAG: penicillin-binding protein [Candidatus Roizmanbacteria bacterium CG_4_9_14_0_8_um_filter_34_12]